MTDKELTPAEKAAAEREKIKVTQSETKTPEEIEAEEVTKKADEEAAEAKAEAEKAALEADKEGSEKTEEELEAELAAAKTQKDKERIQRRIDKEVGKRKELERKVADLEKKLEAKTTEEGETLTREDLEKEAENIASRKILEKEFTAACNRLADAAKKIDKDFDSKVKILAEDIGPIPSQMIGILDDLDNGGAILNHLVNNVDDAEEIWSLSPARMAVRLAKLSATLAEQAKKDKEKKLSKVPEPPEPLGGGARTPTVLTGKESMAEFVRIRNQQVEERRKQRLSGMR